MNVDAQFPPTAFAGTPHRPAQRPAEQATARPVDRPHHNEATGKQTGQQSGQVAERKPADQQAPAGKTPSQKSELSPDEKREVEQLQARDREVRAHEAAHKNAAGHHARGGASFEHETRPGRKEDMRLAAKSVSTSPKSTVTLRPPSPKLRRFAARRWRPLNLPARISPLPPGQPDGSRGTCGTGRAGQR